MSANQSSNINQQAYDYNISPENDAPFWAQEETEEVIDKVTFSASADQTTGDAKVDVTKDGYNVSFAFSGIKGEKGDQGETGATGATGKSGTDGKNGTSVTVTSVDTSESGAIVGYVTGLKAGLVDPDPTDASSYETIQVRNGQKGEKGDTGATGPQGPQGEKGEAGSTDGVVTDVSITNENGVYTVSQTKDGASADIGQIEVPSTDNLIAEVTDSVVENTTTGYDFHTIKETENNGTQNDVGKFYIARKQITGLNSDGTFTTVDQDGNEGSGSISIPSGGDLTTISESDITISEFYDAISTLGLTSKKYYHMRCKIPSSLDLVSGGNLSYSVRKVGDASATTYYPQNVHISNPYHHYDGLIYYEGTYIRFIHLPCTIFLSTTNTLEKSDLVLNNMITNVIYTLSASSPSVGLTFENSLSYARNNRDVYIANSVSTSATGDPISLTTNMTLLSGPSYIDKDHPLNN